MTPWPFSSKKPMHPVLAFYAWVNPLRVKTASTPETLADNNPAVQWQSKSETKRYVITWEDAHVPKPRL